MAKPNLTPEQQEQARNILEMMDDANKEPKNWVGILSLLAFVLVIFIYVAVLVWSPIWLKVIATVYMAWRGFLFWKKMQEKKR